MSEWRDEIDYREFQRELKRVEDRKWRSDTPKLWEKLDNPLESHEKRISKRN